MKLKFLCLYEHTGQRLFDSEQFNDSDKLLPFIVTRLPYVIENPHSQNVATI